jgi:uncharacterized membrane protein (DUF2068 family)
LSVVEEAAEAVVEMMEQAAVEQVVLDK